MITLPSKLGGYCKSISVKYVLQWNTYEEANREQTVVISLLWATISLIVIHVTDTHLALRENTVVVLLNTKLQEKLDYGKVNPQSNLYSSLCPYAITMSPNSLITAEAQQVIRLRARSSFGLLNLCTSANLIARITEQITLTFERLHRVLN